MLCKLDKNKQVNDKKSKKYVINKSKYKTIQSSFLVDLLMKLIQNYVDNKNK